MACMCKKTIVVPFTATFAKVVGARAPNVSVGHFLHQIKKYEGGLKSNRARMDGSMWPSVAQAKRL